MNIMVPVSTVDDVERLCDAGADEIYIGIYDEIWNRKFGSFREINRMSSFGKRANVMLPECLEIINCVRKKNKKVYITFNSATYSIDEVNYIMRLIEKRHLYLADGFIVSDLHLIKKCIEKSYNIILSTMAGVYNSDIVRFYWDMGVKRIILPRDISIDEIELIVSKFPKIEFEVFIMRNGCKYSDSNCMVFHARKYGSMCYCIDNSLDSIRFLNNDCSLEYVKEVFNNNKLFTKVFHKNACGICELERFYKLGITSVKIVGRADNREEILKDVETVRRYIEFYKNANSTVLQENKIFENCWYGLNCYYMRRS